MKQGINQNLSLKSKSSRDNLKATKQKPKLVKLAQRVKVSKIRHSSQPQQVRDTKDKKKIFTDEQYDLMGIVSIVD